MRTASEKSSSNSKIWPYSIPVSASLKEGKISRRYENLVDNEFRSHLLFLVDRYQRTFDEERRLELRRKIAKLNRRILECQRIWEQYAPWDTGGSVSSSNVNELCASSPIRRRKGHSRPILCLRLR